MLRFSSAAWSICSGITWFEEVSVSFICFGPSVLSQSACFVVSQERHGHYCFYPSGFAIKYNYPPMIWGPITQSIVIYRAFQSKFFLFMDCSARSCQSLPHSPSINLAKAATNCRCLKRYRRVMWAVVLSFLCFYSALTYYDICYMLDLEHIRNILTYHCIYCTLLCPCLCHMLARHRFCSTPECHCFLHTRACHCVSSTLACHCIQYMHTSLASDVHSLASVCLIFSLAVLSCLYVLACRCIPGCSLAIVCTIHWLAILFACA